MATWTAKFVNYNAADNTVNVDFVSNDNRVEHASFKPPINLATTQQALVWFKPIAREAIGRLITKDTLSGVTPNIDVTPDPDPTPDTDLTPASVARDKIVQLAQAGWLIDIGLITSADSNYATLLSQAQTAWNGLTTQQKLKMLALCPLKP